MGIRSNVSRNNLAHANETRDWRIFADFARVLIAEARRLYQDEDLGLDLQNTVYAFDSTTGRSNCSSVGSNRTCGLSRFTGRRRTPSGRKSGWRSRFTHSLRS